MRGTKRVQGSGATPLGTYRLPWEDTVKVVDGTSCGFPAPTRAYAGPQAHPLVPEALTGVAPTALKKVA